MVFSLKAGPAASVRSFVRDYAGVAAPDLCVKLNSGPRVGKKSPHSLRSEVIRIVRCDGRTAMDRSHSTGSERPRRAARSYAQFIPVVWIVVLLASWFVIVDWKMLPDLVNATMAALP
jgi:hypothetical protein